ncbi:MAG: hypothetical protein QM673_07830 [Gordonia sp. (in: high G+C Gram-positive bacteria)]
MALTASRITWRLIPGAILVVLTVASVALAGFLGVRYWDARGTQAARDSSLAAARDYATTMFGYDPVNVADHVKRSKQVVTGAAKTEYDRLIAKPLPDSADDFVAGVRAQRVVSQAVIQDAGVVTNTRNTSTVLIFMDQSVSRNGKDLVRLDPSRLTFSMVNRDGRWLIETIDVITDDSFRSSIRRVATPPPGAVPLPGPSSSAPVTTPR